MSSSNYCHVYFVTTALAWAYLIEVYGCGRIAVLASIVATLSLFISFFLDSLMLLYITLGAFTGMCKHYTQVREKEN